MKVKIKAYKRFFQLLLIVCILCSAWQPYSAAAKEQLLNNPKSDLSQHWAKDTMEKWIELGLINGYRAGSYLPEAAISRAEFATLVSRIFNLSVLPTASISFTDVNSDAWYASVVSNVYDAGMVQGIGEARFAPLSQITREDAAVLVARAFRVANSQQTVTAFADASLISPYALSAVTALQAKGYVKGKGNNCFAPKDSIKRAEAVQIINNIMGTIVAGKSTASSNLPGNVIINSKDTILKNQIVSGDLFITQGVGEGEVILSGVTVKGTTYVLGGGMNSVKIIDSSLEGPLVVDKKNSKIRVLASGSTQIKHTVMLTGGFLVEEDLTGENSGFDDVEVIIGETISTRDVKLQGHFGAVHNSNKGVIYELTANTIIDVLTLDSAANVVGEGNIKVANLNADGSVFSKWPVKVNFGHNITATIGSKLVDKDIRIDSSIVVPPTSGSTTTTPPVVEPDPEKEPANKLKIVEAGNPKATVIVSASADEQTRKAADKLIEYVRKSTGVELPLVVDDSTSDKLTAENGVVHIQLFNQPTTIPTAADFKVKAIINGTAGLNVHPSHISWEPATNTATLAVQSVEPANVQQTIQYQVIYQNGDTGYSPDVIIAANAQAPIDLNPSFEIGYSGAQDAKPWKYWYDGPGTQMISRSNEQARSGSFSIKASGTSLAWPNQDVVLTESGDYEFSAYIYTPQGSTTQGTVQMYTNLMNPAGVTLASYRSAITAATVSNGSWEHLSWEVVIPEAIAGAPIHKIQMGFELKGFVNGETIYIDDVELSHKNVDTNRTAAADKTLARDAAAETNSIFNSRAPTQIYVGKKGLSSQEQTDLLGNKTSDSFVIHQNGDRITIAGPTAWGTEFGVSEFLERYVDVRWLMPGTDWEDVPLKSSLSVPIGDEVSQEPAFFSRTFESTGNKARTDWMQNMRLHHSVEFTHNLFNLLPVNKYLATNPQFYPTGVDLTKEYTWQPCFKAEGIVEESIKNINAYFDNNPEATSYSIGINDTRNFCEGNPSNPNYPNKMNSIGMVDMSNIFFQWVKEVSEGVFAVHPDKFLGTYAYYNVYDPPTNVVLDPRVVVYITDDRMSWGDTELREAGHSITEAWKQSGATVAFYDYLYGSPYMVPRTPFNLMADEYRYAASMGIDAFYSEVYPNFGEGPKPYLSAKLQWDPSQNVDKLLNEWYERAVGSAAAPELKAYYEIWQRFWEQDIYQSEWFKSWKDTFPRSNFMPLFLATYLSDVSVDDLVESRRLLESAIRKTETPQQKKRAEDLLHMFEYYEISKASYPDQETIITDPTNDAEAKAILDKGLEKIALMDARFALVADFAKDDIYMQTVEPIKWDVISNNEIFALARWISGNPTSRLIDLIDDLATTSPSSNVKDFMNKIKSASYGTGVRNPGFEDGLSNWYGYPDTTAELTSDVHTGSKAIKVNTSSIEQTVFVESGKTYNLSFYSKVTGAASSNLVGMNFWDVPGVGLAGARVTVDSTQYKKYNIKFTAPNGFSHATIVIYKEPSEGWVYADDFTLTEWSSAEEVLLTSVSGGNGVVNAVLSNTPHNAPAAADFTVQPIINGVAARSAVPSNVTWDAVTKTARLSVLSVPAAAVEQHVVYKVMYEGGEAVNSESVTIAADALAPVNFNPSFEIGYEGSQDANPWRYWYDGGGESTVMFRSNEQAKSGSYSLKAIGSNVAWPNQDVALTKGEYEFSAYIYAPQGSTTSGTVQLFVNLQNAAGNHLQALKSEIVPAKNSNGNWLQIKFNVTVPESIGSDQVTKAMMGLELLGFNGVEAVYIDDVKLAKKDTVLLTSVSGGNGFVNAVLSNSPSNAPKAADFTVQQVINGAAALSAVPSNVTWNAATKTVTLSVLGVPTAAVEQHVVYKVKYEGGEAVNSESVTIAADALAPVNFNPSFEIGYEGSQDANPWRYWYDGGGESTVMFRSNEQAKSGIYSLKAIGSNVAWPNQDVALTKGEYEFSAYIYAPQGSTTKGTVQLFVNLQNAAGNHLQALKSEIVPATNSNGNWLQIKFNVTVPESIGSDQVTKAMMGLELLGFNGAEAVYIDDVKLAKIS